MRRLPGAMVCALFFTSVLGRPVGAQGSAAGPNGGEDLTYLSVNAVIGGLTAGILSKAKGRAFLGPFARGLLGGAVSYGGKRIGGTTLPGSGLVGRQVAAVGASFVRNAAVGAGILDTLFLPLGPGRLHVPLGGRSHPAYHVDLEEVAWLVYSFSRPNLEFDLGESLSSGAFVFVGDEQLRGENDTAVGRAASGVISVRRIGLRMDQATLAHERTHIAQLDALKIVYGLPFEGWLRREWGLRPGGWLDHVDVGIAHYPLLWMMTAPWSFHGDRPLEREAEYLEALAGGSR